MTVIEKAPESPQGYLDVLVSRSKAGLFPSDDNLLPIPAFARTGNKEVDIRRLDAVQAVHDDMAYGPWNHDEFVRRLLGLELFKGLTPTPTGA